MDIENIKEEMVADYESFYQAETGEKITLYPADRDRIKLNVVANKLYQAYQCIEKGFRMNFLKYAHCTPAPPLELFFVPAFEN